MTGAIYDLAIIGGGLIGLSVAVAARKRGLDVCLMEAAHCGRYASSASAGGVRSLMRQPPEIPLARAALPLWHGLQKELGAPCGFHATGQIRVAEDEDALQALEARASRTRELGFDHEKMIGSNALRKRLPDISHHCLGALIVEDDGFADPLATLHAYRKKALAEGALILEGTQVRTLVSNGSYLCIETDEGTVLARTCVNAAGAWGADLSESVGEPVPMQMAALQMIVTAPVPHFVSEVIGSEGKKLSLKQSAAGAVIIGGGFRGRLACDTTGAQAGFTIPTNVAQNLENAARLFPHLQAARMVRSWVGIEGMMDDGLPVIGESNTLPGLFHAFGFSGHGFALVPLIGPMVVDLIDGCDGTHPLDAFSINRFGQVRIDQTPTNRDKLERVQHA